MAKILVFPCKYIFGEVIGSQLFFFKYFSTVLFVSVQKADDDCPILWQDWTSFAVTWTLISDRMAFFLSSRSSSLTLSVVPDKMRLFLWSYCSRSSVDDCRTSTLFLNNHILPINVYCLPWVFLWPRLSDC